MGFLTPYLTYIKIGVLVAVVATIGLLYWRVDYLARENSRLSDTIRTQEKAIADLTALNLKKDAAAKKDAARTVANAQKKSKDIIEIERMKDEKNAPLRGGFNDVVERLFTAP